MLGMEWKWRDLTIEKGFCNECVAEAQAEAREKFRERYLDLIYESGMAIIPFSKWPEEARQAWDDIGEKLPNEVLCCVFWAGDRSVALCQRHVRIAHNELKKAQDKDIVDSSKGVSL
jgi:hypothetical protein